MAAATYRTVTQQVAQAYTYDPTTARTRVTRHSSRTVRARFVGTAVSTQTPSGSWARIPYVWSPVRNALVYEHRLHLILRYRAPASQASAARPSPEHVTDDPIRHLLRRASYGPTDTSLAEARRLGVAGWVDQQLHPSTIDDAACEAVLARLPRQSEPIWKVHAMLHSGEREEWEQVKGVLVAHVVRAAWSRRQLLAVMEDFWSNHFNVTTPEADVPESRAHYAHVLRTGAFGRFSDLLRAVTRHPAMLTYLNNRESTREQPNENHGRELLELHTVGVGSGYGESGVLAAARILTGLSVSHDSEEYQYQPWRHWTGPVEVMGFQHANPTQTGGEAVALALIDHLAHHPRTARRIAFKLARHFVADSPPESLVARLAQTYLANDTAIAPVLRQLLLSDEFAASVGAKSRRPFEQLMATVRVLGLGPEPGPETGGIAALVWHAEDAGHAPLGSPAPDGYPDTADAWISTGATLARWNSMMSLVANWWPSTLTRVPLRQHIFGPTVPATHGAAIDTIATRLFGRTLGTAHREAALAFLGVTAADPVHADSGVLTWHLDQVVGLLLDSPYHLVR